MCLLDHLKRLPNSSSTCPTCNETFVFTKEHKWNEREILQDKARKERHQARAPVTANSNSNLPLISVNININGNNNGNSNTITNLGSNNTHTRVNSTSVRQSILSSPSLSSSMSSSSISSSPSVSSTSATTSSSSSSSSSSLRSSGWANFTTRSVLTPTRSSTSALSDLSLTLSALAPHISPPISPPPQSGVDMSYNANFSNNMAGWLESAAEPILHFKVECKTYSNRIGRYFSLAIDVILINYNCPL
jgi:hypothetical protein